MGQVYVVMPELGTEIEEAQIDLWHNQAGESVEEGAPLLSITTPKVTMDIDAPASGVLKEILVEEDELAKVGTQLAIIET